MKVQEVMSGRLETCHPWDSLNEAARLMWDGDFGWVPVVDQGERLVGVITDRDICMAAYTRGRPLRELPVAAAMCREVCCCGPDDSLEDKIVFACGQRDMVSDVCDIARRAGCRSLCTEGGME